MNNPVVKINKLNVIKTSGKLKIWETNEKKKFKKKKLEVPNE